MAKIKKDQLDQLILDIVKNPQHEFHYAFTDRPQEARKIALKLRRRLKIPISVSYRSEAPALYYPSNTPNPQHLKQYPAKIPTITAWPTSRKELLLHESGHHIISQTPYRFLDYIYPYRIPATAVSAGIGIPISIYKLLTGKKLQAAGFAFLPLLVNIGFGITQPISEGLASLTGYKVGEMLNEQQLTQPYALSQRTYMEKFLPIIKLRKNMH